MTNQAETLYTYKIWTGIRNTVFKGNQRHQSMYSKALILEPGYMKYYYLLWTILSWPWTEEARKLGSFRPTLGSCIDDTRKGKTKQKTISVITTSISERQLISFAGHIAALFVARGLKFQSKRQIQGEILAVVGQMWPASPTLPSHDISH